MEDDSAARTHATIASRSSRPDTYRAQGTTLSKPLRPNDLWCADYKGEFMLADRRYCYPLTISDFASRYLLACEALSSTKERYHPRPPKPERGRLKPFLCGMLRRSSQQKNRLSASAAFRGLAPQGLMLTTTNKHSYEGQKRCVRL